MTLFLPEYVKKVLEALEKNGFTGYAVGGCVRDILMGKSPHDYDVTTDALPETVERIFEKTIPTGIKHGTVTVISDGHPIEVTTFRTENGYTDSRRPDSVNFVTDIADDLSRRDFTVNAIAYNDRNGLIDPFGGRADIDAKILKAVGEPERRFQEDALRILRLFRFASQLGFTPESRSLDAALCLSDGLQKISRERISVELIKAVCVGSPDAILPLLKCGALKFLGISAPLSLSALTKLTADENIRLAAFIILCGADAEDLSHELKFSNSRREQLAALCTLHSAPPEVSRPELKRAMCRYGVTAVCEIFRINEALYGAPSTEALALIEDIIHNGEPYELSSLAVNGKLLSDIGIHGRELGKALSLLLDAVINDPTLNTKEQLLEIAAKLP